MSEDELPRLRHIENMALRVASSRRNGVVTDKGALDNLDAALESTTPPAPHTHTDTCWEADSGCDMGRNANYVAVSPETKVIPTLNPLLQQLEAWIAANQTYACVRQYPQPRYAADFNPMCTGCLIEHAALELRKRSAEKLK